LFFAFENYLTTFQVYEIPIQKRHLKLPLHFWVTLFEKMLQPLNVGNPSRKSISNFVQAIKGTQGINKRKNDEKYVKCNLSGCITAYYMLEDEILKLYIQS
jgi:hypothetical protein